MSEGRFYPHGAHPELSGQRLAAAKDKGPSYSDAWFAELNLVHLQQVAEWGIPDCYETFCEWLVDFGVDFAWGCDEFAAQAKMVRDDPRMPVIAKKIWDDWEGFDITDWLDKAIIAAKLA
jgi:hypothetical protein